MKCEDCCCQIFIIYPLSFEEQGPTQKPFLKGQIRGPAKNEPLMENEANKKQMETNFIAPRIQSKYSPHTSVAK